MRRETYAAIVGAALLTSSPDAGAEPLTLGGITFSDELGGVVLRDGWGSGSAKDPFVLIEEINDEGPAILVVRGLRQRAGGGLQPSAENGFSLTKIVTNRTARPWAAFELELRERLDQPSTYEDGLSFAQAAWSGRGFSADRFARVSTTDEPLDAVVFSDGMVLPGETVTVMAMITDYTPGEAFFLLQRREGPVAAAPAKDQRYLATISVELSTPILSKLESRNALARSRPSANSHFRKSRSALSLEE